MENLLACLDREWGMEISDPKRWLREASFSRKRITENKYKGLKRKCGIHWGIWFNIVTALFVVQGGVENKEDREDGKQRYTWISPHRNQDGRKPCSYELFELLLFSVWFFHEDLWHQSNYENWLPHFQLTRICVNSGENFSTDRTMAIFGYQVKLCNIIALEYWCIAILL